MTRAAARRPQPRSDSAELLRRAVDANGAHRSARALALCDVALNAGPAAAVEAALPVERASAHLARRDWVRAERDCLRALELGAGARAYALLAQSRLERGAGGEAVSAVEAALALDAELPGVLELHARALSADRRHDAAVDAARRAYARAGSASTLATLVTALGSAGRQDELVALLEVELASTPDAAGLWTSLGVSLNALGRSEAAVGAFRRAIALDADNGGAKCGLGMALLRLGHTREGFAYNEHRQHAGGSAHRFGVPPWRGESLASSHLMIFAEQGFGDVIQFARYVPLVRRLARQVSFFVPPPLVRLLGSNPELGPSAPGHPGFRGADFQTLLLSLPHLLGADPGYGGSALPLLVPEPERVAYWRKVLPGGPKLAFAWQGNPRYAGEPWRSMPCAKLRPLLELEGVTFVSLQKHFGREQLAGTTPPLPVLDLADLIDAEGHAFVDSLAILALVDLFVTTDTALAHVAGSAGVRTWLLLSHVPDWRWGTHPERTAWYQSVRLFRQDAWGAWDGVIARVRGALEAELARATALASI